MLFLGGLDGVALGDSFADVGLPIPKFPARVPIKPQRVGVIPRLPHPIADGGSPRIPLDPVLARKRILDEARKHVDKVMGPISKLPPSQRMPALEMGADMVRPGGGMRIRARFNAYINEGKSPRKAMHEALAREIAATSMTNATKISQKGETYALDRIPVEVGPVRRRLGVQGLGGAADMFTSGLETGAYAAAAGMTGAVKDTTCSNAFTGAMADAGGGLAHEYGSSGTAAGRIAGAMVAGGACAGASELDNHAQGAHAGAREREMRGRRAYFRGQFINFVAQQYIAMWRRIGGRTWTSKSACGAEGNRQVYTALYRWIAQQVPGDMQPGGNYGYTFKTRGASSQWAQYRLEGLARAKTQYPAWNQTCRRVRSSSSSSRYYAGGPGARIGKKKKPIWPWIAGGAAALATVGVVVAVS